MARNLAHRLVAALSDQSVTDWIDRNISRNELGREFALYPHQREVLRLMFAFDEDGRLPWDTLVYSCVKKSGKSTLNAAVALWWAMTQDAPSEIILCANDLEQSQSRCFSAILKLLKYNDIDSGARGTTTEIRLSNDTVIKAVASDFAGSAGSNHGLTSWDELWGYTSESSRRLWEELTPVPTRQNSIRFISTYAGWEAESMLLSEIYRQGVGPEEHPDGQGERLHPELPIYGNREARLCVYWDHEPRMPWQTPAYYAAQRKTLRPGTYLRLHENRWATSEERFITPELWDPCVDALHTPLLPMRGYPLFVGVDAATKHDSAAVVCVRWDGQKLALARHRIWQPSPDEPLDIEATIEEELRYLHEHYQVRAIVCDPYQLHRTITTLRNEGLPIEEFPQSSGNLTRMGSALFDLLNGRNLILYFADDLRGQALQTVSVESARGWKISKEKASHKIDAIVGLSMACVSALDHGHTVAISLSPGEMEAIWAEARAKKAQEGLAPDLERPRAMPWRWSSYRYRPRW